MSSIGPQLPPQPSKRKRTPDDAEDPSSPPPKASKNNDEIDLDDSDSDGYGPSAPAAPRPAVGPTLPPPSNRDEIDLDSDDDTGPAPPPGAVPPPQPDDASSSDSDDDYGPSLPTASSAARKPIGPALPPTEEAPQRDSWMLAPPPSSSTFAERDPTRLRARKFASSAPGKPPPSAPSGPSSIWTETPEEKLQRLQNAVLGRGADAAAEEGGTAKSGRSKEDEERDARIAASIEARRGKSLYAEHQGKREQAGEAKEEDDDPSKRGFDREKDMALGGKIGTTQRKELMNKAANFGGRFQKGSFL